jgi:hypothetical protein
MGSSICPGAKIIVFLKIPKKVSRKPTGNGQRLSQSSITRNNVRGVIDLVKNPDQGSGILHLKSFSSRLGGYATSAFLL